MPTMSLNGIRKAEKYIKIHTFGIVVMVEKIDLLLMINVRDKCRK